VLDWTRSEAIAVWIDAVGSTATAVREPLRDEVVGAPAKIESTPAAGF